ncbi:MAG: hypothetical protein KAR42_14365 [candidate division Zixibacteria bacterium]|nr:hypothetical protein [candidate division Zixibacteria bacterium]
MPRFLIYVFVVFIVGFASAESIRITADIPGDSAYADSVINVTHQRLVSLLGAIPADSLHVYIVDTQERFDSLSGGYVPDWGAGVAIPLRRLIVIKSPLIMTGDKTLGELVAHEYTHIIVARKTKYRPIPRWMNEGMAMYFSTEWDWHDNMAVGMAVLFGYTVKLKDIEKLNRFTHNRAETAYAESYLAFDLFLDSYGNDGLQIFLENIAKRRKVNHCFVLATGSDYLNFEKEFADFLYGRYNVLALIFNSNIIWLLLAFVIIIGFIINRVKRKSRMRELDEYDSLHSTDFDYGEVEKPDEDKPWD